MTSYSVVLKTVPWFRPLTAESRIRFQAIPYLICDGGENNARRGYSRIISIFPDIISSVLYNLSTLRSH